MKTQDYIAQAILTESKPTPELIARLVQNVRPIHAILGLETEVGELTDPFKRHVFYGQSLDHLNIEEEVGDIMWYLAIMLDCFGVKDIADVMERNIAKLRSRYPNKFTEYDAVNRDLEKERVALENTLKDLEGRILPPPRRGLSESDEKALAKIRESVAAEKELQALQGMQYMPPWNEENAIKVFTAPPHNMTEQEVRDNFFRKSVPPHQQIDHETGAWSHIGAKEPGEPEVGLGPPDSSQDEKHKGIGPNDSGWD